MADNKIIPKSEVEPVDSVTLSRYDSSKDELKYSVHDQNIRETDPDKVIAEKYGYDLVAEREYPTMTQGPWVKVGDKDMSLHELGFTHPDLHRECSVVMPGVGRIYLVDQEGKLKKVNGEVYYLEEDNTDEITPREYEVSIMNVNSYRTTRKTTHVDYQNLSSFKSKYPDYSDMIDERAAKSELNEIP